MNKAFIQTMKELRPDLEFLNLEEEAKRLPQKGTKMIYIGESGKQNEEVTVLHILKMPNRHYICIEFGPGETLTCYLDHLRFPV